MDSCFLALIEAQVKNDDDKKFSYDIKGVFRKIEAKGRNYFLIQLDLLMAFFIFNFI